MIQQQSSAYYLDIGSDSAGILQAAKVLQNGGLVAFPTETVYGLGANALNDAAVRSVFEAKGRPASDPLIVHIVDISNIDTLFDFQGGSNARDICLKLADAFWPGPLTLVHKAKSIIPLSVTSGSGYVGLRYPRHPIARALIQAAGLPIAAPSANRFGHVSPTSSNHVMEDLHDQPVAILRDNLHNDSAFICDVGIESTVCRISMTGDSISILRCGAVTSEDIDQVMKRHHINCVVTVDNEKSISKSKSSAGSHPIQDIQHEVAVAPGQMIKHYSPDVPTYLLSSSNVDRIISPSGSHSASIHSPSNSSSELLLSLQHVIVIDYAGKLSALRSLVKSYVDLSVEGDIEAAYRQIFNELRNAEKLHADDPTIQCLFLPDLSEASQSSEKVRALWERIHRAASGEFIV